MKNFVDKNEKNRQGYHDAHQLIQNARTLVDLRKAIEKCVEIIKACDLDYVQQEKLEQYGFKRYEQMTNAYKNVMRNRKY